MISQFSKQQTLEFYRRARWAGLVGGDGMELVGPGYSRAPVSFGVTPMGLANVSPVMFPVAPAPWGVAVSLALFDEAGNHLLGDPLEQPVEIRARDQFVFPPGAVTVSMAETPEEAAI